VGAPWWALRVEVPSDISEALIESIEVRFHDQHERLFTFSMRELRAQILHRRVRNWAIVEAGDGRAEGVTEYAPDPAIRRLIYLSIAVRVRQRPVARSGSFGYFAITRWVESECAMPGSI
jgi:hypothetical protein